MKRKFLTGLLATLVIATGNISCNDDDHFEYATSNECIITSMTIGALKREMHTKNAKGEDSTFYVSVTGALYPLSIDQINQRIFNVDSLPVGTDVSKAVFSALNAIGTFSIRSLQTGNDTIFALSDSTDFSVPRIVTVHATDGVSKRNYQVTLNVHKEKADTMIWNQLTATPAAFSDLKETKSLAMGHQLYIFGEQDGQSQVLSADAQTLATGATSWDVAKTSAPICTQSVVIFGHQFYTVNADQQLLTSTDGTTWTPVNTTFTASHLVASGSQHMIALKGGKFFSSPDGCTWTEDAADEPLFLPEEGATGTCIPSAVDKSFETLVVVGQHQGKNVVWKREIDLVGGEVYPWLYLPETTNSAFNIPAYQNISLMTYDGAVMLSGLTQEGTGAPLLTSRDHGRTWKQDIITTPAFQVQNDLAVCVDDQHFIWMFCGQSGETWRGRINRLGWDEIPGSFNKSAHR